MPTGIINAKSKQTISITFKPQLRYEFDIDMVCVARERMDDNLKAQVKGKIYESEAARINTSG